MICLYYWLLIIKLHFILFCTHIVTSKNDMETLSFISKSLYICASAFQIKTDTRQLTARIRCHAQRCKENLFIKALITHTNLQKNHMIIRKDTSKDKMYPKF